MGGWKTAGEVFSFINDNKMALLFVILAAISSLILAYVFAVLCGYKGACNIKEIFFTIGDFFDKYFVSKWDFQKTVSILLFYLILSFINTFFGSALAYCVYRSSKYGKSSIGEGFAAAGKNIISIILWSLISSTILVILDIIGYVFERFGEILKPIFGWVWYYVTFFIIPIMVVENINPFNAIGRSTSMIRSNFLETYIGQVRVAITNFIIRLFVGLIATIMLLIAIVPPASNWPWAVPLIVVFFILMYCYSSASWQVFAASMYYEISEKNSRGVLLDDRF